MAARMIVSVAVSISMRQAFVFFANWRAKVDFPAAGIPVITKSVFIDVVLKFNLGRVEKIETDPIRSYGGAYKSNMGFRKFIVPSRDPSAFFLRAKTFSALCGSFQIEHRFRSVLSRGVGGLFSPFVFLALRECEEVWSPLCLKLLINRHCFYFLSR